MRNHYSTLKETTESCIQIIADKMYSAELINREVKSRPTFEKIEIEFSAIMSLFAEDLNKIEKNCYTFVYCIASAKGPAEAEAIKLAKEWQHKVFESHQVSFSLLPKMDQQVTCCLQKITLDCPEDVIKEFSCLQRKFASLITRIRKFYDRQSGIAIDIARWVEEYKGIGSLASGDTTVDKVFQSMKPYYNLLDIDLIESLVEEYPIDESLLQSEFKEYVTNRENFVDKAEIGIIIAKIENALDEQKDSNVDPKVVLKLSKQWKKEKFAKLKELTKLWLGEENAKHLTITKLESGCIMVQYLVSNSNLLPSIVNKTQAKTDLLCRLGIFKVHIDCHTIINEEENTTFTFEASLLHAIKNIEKDIEYERMAFLLIDFKIQLNYQNNEGDTALFNASEGGHIEIFKSLLWSGTDTFVQRPNKTHIGLNTLACTALSQHIFKSFGGERLIPQEGTSVGDLLERVVQEKGIEGFHYHSFISLIFGKLQERDEKLFKRFQELDDRFTVATTTMLGREVSLADTRQHLHSYVEENMHCDSVHQLIKLLQPHYSYLNVTLLSVMSAVLGNQDLRVDLDQYISELNRFKNVTSLLELAMASKDKEKPHMDRNCAKLEVKFNKAWGSKTITELSKFENYSFLSSATFLNLVHIKQCQSTSLTCTYLVPPSQKTQIFEIAAEKHNFFSKVGIYEVLIDESPLMTRDEGVSFSFETSLLEAYKSNDESVLFFLPELNIQLPSVTASAPELASVQQVEVEDEELEGVMREDVLFEAIKQNDVRRVQKLLNKGCDIDYQGEREQTFLMAAITSGNTEIAKVLLKKHPNVNLQDRYGNNALIMASFRGYTDIVHLLLDESPLIDMQNNEGMTALMIAACNGEEKVVEQLLNNGARTDIANLDGKTAWSFAMDHGYPHIAEML